MASPVGLVSKRWLQVTVPPRHRDHVLRTSLHYQIHNCNTHTVRRSIAALGAVAAIDSVPAMAQNLSIGTDNFYKTTLSSSSQSPFRTSTR